jgi:hypothetical protein
MDRIEVNVQTGEVKIIVEEPVPTSEPEPVPE